MSYKKEHMEAINLYIKKLKENGLNKNIKVIDEIDYYVIYIYEKRDNKIRKILNETSYEVHTKFEGRLYKSIQCQYFYDWYKDEEALKNEIENKKIVDITFLFENEIENKKTIYINSFYINSLFSLIYSVVEYYFINMSKFNNNISSEIINESLKNNKNKTVIEDNKKYNKVY